MPHPVLLCYSEGMDLATISSFFDQSVPIGVVAILIYQAVMGRDIKHINENLKEVKLALSNHVTDTNKKIDAVNAKLDKLLIKNS